MYKPLWLNISLECVDQEQAQKLQQIFRDWYEQEKAKDPTLPEMEIGVDQED